jgi:hypothetical protein
MGQSTGRCGAEHLFLVGIADALFFDKVGKVAFDVLLRNQPEVIRLKGPKKLGKASGVGLDGIFYVAPEAESLPKSIDSPFHMAQLTLFYEDKNKRKAFFSR